MKFDVVRTQKNDAYCSVVELAEADLRSVCGGQLLDIPVALPVTAVGDTIGLIAVGLDQGNSNNEQNSQRLARSNRISSVDEGDWD